LAVVFVIVLSGCNGNKAAPQDEGQSGSVAQSSEQVEQDIGNENVPRLSKFILGPGDELEIMVIATQI